MNKKILLGSIIAVAILVLVSFTSVVGYGSVEPNVKASALFNIRTSRAIDRDSKGLTCDYVGKNKGIALSFPTRVGRTASLQRAQRLIDLISKMNDKTFDSFIATVINHLFHDNKIWEEHISEIVNVLHLLRNNPDRIANRIVDRNTDLKFWSKYDTCFLCYSSSPPLCLTYDLPFILCVPLFILLSLASIVLNLLLLLSVGGLC